MLLVRTRIGPSAIHGTGLFAVDPIARGTAVWRFTPGFDLDLDPVLIDAQPQHTREMLQHYGYVDPRRNRYVLCCDDARFINHSDTPNLRPQFGEDPHGVDVAIRDIDANEEITIDYQQIEGVRSKKDGA